MTATAQHMTALSKANQVRQERAALRAVVEELPERDGMLLIADALDWAPEHCASLPAVRLVGWVRDVGRYRAGRICRRAGVSEFVTVKGLTGRQIRALKEQLGA